MKIIFELQQQEADLDYALNRPCASSTDTSPTIEFSAHDLRRSLAEFSDLEATLPVKDV